MKRGYIILSVGISFIIGVAIPITLNLIHGKTARSRSDTTLNVPSDSPTPTPYAFQLQPPSQALSAQLTNRSGIVKKQARGELDQIEASQDGELVEGELMSTAQDATADLLFPTGTSMKLGPQTTLSLSSTDPAHFLIRQDIGTATYTTDETINRISIRTLSSLFELSRGEVTVQVDPDLKRVIFVLNSGSGQLGYIDQANQTQIATVSAGERVVFDDQGREVK